MPGQVNYDTLQKVSAFIKAGKSVSQMLAEGTHRSDLAKEILNT